MDDRDAVDDLYRLWAATTGAHNSYWQVVAGEHRITAGGQWVAAGLSEADMAWVCAAHTAFPDLVRRLHEALDEADRLDRERDEREQLIADLLKEGRDD